MKRRGLIALAVVLLLLLIGAVIYGVVRLVTSVRPTSNFNLVTYPPGDIFEVPANTRFEILCDYDQHYSNEVTQIEWKYNGPGYGYIHTEYFRNLSSKLIFEPAILQHGVRYTCKGSQGEDVKSRTVRINVRNFSPYFNSSRVTVKVYEGKSVELHCEPYSTELVSFEWDSLEEKNLNTSADKFYVIDSYNSSTLYIEEVQANHERNYNCKAKNIYGSSSTQFNLLVINEAGPPRFLDTFGGSKAKLYDRVELYCEAEGKRPMDFTWDFKDSGVYSPSRSLRSLPVHIKSASVLIINSIQRWDYYDYRTYICTANNSLGQASREFAVYHWRNPGPEFNKTEEHVNAYEGSSAEMCCKIMNDASYEDILHYRWLDPKGKQFNATHNLYVKNKNDAYCLHIEKVQTIHEGTFHCIAESYGQKATKTFELRVIQVEGPSKFLKTSDCIPATLKARLERPCVANGERPMDYTWYNQDGKIISSDQSLPVHVLFQPHNVSVLVFTIFQKHHFGQYTCTANNSLGQASTVYSFIPPRAPDSK